MPPLAIAVYSACVSLVFAAATVVAPASVGAMGVAYVVLMVFPAACRTRNRRWQ